MREKLTREGWAAARLALYERARGRCEFCGDHLGNVAEVHHRQMRSQGGDDAPENLAIICPPCHRHAHRHPARAYEVGWLVPSWADPADVLPLLIPWSRR